MIAHVEAVSWPQVSEGLTASIITSVTALVIALISAGATVVSALNQRTANKMVREQMADARLKWAHEHHWQMFVWAAATALDDDQASIRADAGVAALAALGKREDLASWDQDVITAVLEAVVTSASTTYTRPHHESGGQQ